MISSEKVPEHIRDKIRAVKAALIKLRASRDELTQRCRNLKRLGLSEEQQVANAKLKSERDAAAAAVLEKDRELKLLIAICKSRDKALGDSHWNPNTLRKQAMRSQLYWHGADLSESADD
jgi:hypothetical protein